MEYKYKTYRDEIDSRLNENNIIYQQGMSKLKPKFKELNDYFIQNLKDIDLDDLYSISGNLNSIAYFISLGDDLVLLKQYKGIRNSNETDLKFINTCFE